MFFRKKKDILQVAKSIEKPWDDKTLKYFTKSNQFNIKITHVTHLMGFGRTRADHAIHEPDEYEVSGVIPYPKCIPVDVRFEQQSNFEFGLWYYNIYERRQVHPRGVKPPDIPFLELCLFDPEGRIREALYEAHKAAMLCERRYSAIRVWKREGDGVMTPQEREDGYSSQSRYPILGVYIWAEIEATNLPTWAVPYDSDRFSMENMPESYELKL
jgi:hypothetical protein